MAAQYIPIKRISSLDAPITAEKLDGSLFTTENQAHEFIISVRKNGVKQTVAGSVSGKFIRANGTTIFLQGSIVDGDAVVRLHQDCYNVQGRFTFNIFNTQSGVTTCIYSAVGKIDIGSTETVIDAGDVVPDVSDVVAAQEAAQAAITAANTAAQTANTAAQNVGSIVARPYSSSSTYTAGDYCTNNGNLYKANQNISTAEEWTASHWTQIVMGDEVTDLKSALKINAQGNQSLTGYIYIDWENGLIDTTSGANYPGYENSFARSNGYIKVSEGDVIYHPSLVGTCIVFWYDSEKVYKRYQTMTDSLEVPEGIAYCRIRNSLPVANGDISQLNGFLLYSKNSILYNDTEEKINNVNNKLGFSSFLSRQFVVGAGQTHSSTLDTVDVNIKKGEEFLIACNTSSTITSPFVNYSDGTRGQVAFFGVASNDIVSVGLYVQNTSEEAINVSYTVVHGYKNIDMFKGTDYLAILKNKSGFCAIQGNGNSVVTTLFDVIKAGHVYRVFIKQWATEGITENPNAYRIRVGYQSNGTVTYLASTITTEPVPDYIDVFIPDDVATPLLAIQSRITKDEIGFVVVADITDNIYLPDYAQTSVDSILSLLKTQQTSASILFAFLTDIHVADANMNGGVLKSLYVSKNAINSINESNPIDLCVFNGDYLNNSTSTTKQTALSWYDQFNHAINGIKPIEWRGSGNHDYNDINTTVSEHITPEEFYSAFEKYADLNSFVMEYGNVERDYGYIDFPNKKTRFIFINTVDMPEAYAGNDRQHTKGISNNQLNFVANALKFDSDDWAVVFISHHALQNNIVLNPDASEDGYLTPEHGGTPLIGVINAFIDKTSYEYSSNDPVWSYSVSVDYTTNQSNEVIAMFSGHTHRDAMTTVDGYAMVSSTATGGSVAAVDEDGNRISRQYGTITETSWDVITIDRKNKMIYADRYGAGKNQVRSIAYGS